MTTYDDLFVRELDVAQRSHDRYCKCRTKFRLTGHDGPDMRCLMAALKVAQTLDRHTRPDLPDDEVARHAASLRDALREFRETMRS